MNRRRSSHQKAAPSRKTGRLWNRQLRARSPGLFDLVFGGVGIPLAAAIETVGGTHLVGVVDPTAGLGARHGVGRHREPEVGDDVATAFDNAAFELSHAASLYHRGIV